MQIHSNSLKLIRLSLQTRIDLSSLTLIGLRSLRLTGLNLPMLID